MTPKDNSRLTLSAYSDWLEENNHLELAEKIRGEINNAQEHSWIGWRPIRIGGVGSQIDGMCDSFSSDFDGVGGRGIGFEVGSTGIRVGGHREWESGATIS